MPDIFDEVDEDLRAERTRQFFLRWGGALVAAAVLVVAGIGGWELWKRHQTELDARMSDQYIAAMRGADEPPHDAKASAAKFASVAAVAPSGYRTLARLREAAMQADAGDLDGASATWDQVASDGGADRNLRDLASLQWSLHHLDRGDPAQVASRLAPLAVPDNPYHALAQEAQAILALRQGNAPAARDTLKQLAQDATAPDGVRGRANGLLVRLGGQPNG